MKWWALCIFGLLAACNSQTIETTAPVNQNSVSIPRSGELTNDTVSSVKDSATHDASPMAPSIKKPSGIYEFLFPYTSSVKILHTIEFTASGYRLQEAYLNKRDSVVITQGTWAPSQGFIWLYKDQVVRGRYSWQGDTLQYYSPRLKQKFSLTKMVPAYENTAWKEKAATGTVLLGIGTEPFWSIEITKQDSSIFTVPDWAQPLHVKLSSINQTADSTVYAAVADSLQVTIFPYFCSDGMSDFVYPRKVVVRYKNQLYKGCASLL